MKNYIKIIAVALLLSIVYFYRKIKAIKFDLKSVKFENSLVRPKIDVEFFLFNPFPFSIPLTIDSVDVVEGSEKVFMGSRDLKFKLESRRQNTISLSAIYAKEENFNVVEFLALATNKDRLYIDLEISIFGIKKRLYEKLVN